jgi:hypothetical protein
MQNLGDDNGCLARVPGDLIAAALAQLPKPEEASEKMGTASVHLPDLGNVRITCVLRHDPRKERRYWSPLRADPDPGATAPPVT